MALRWCTGGSKYDIAATYAVHPNAGYNSLWEIQATYELNINFPSTYTKQPEKIEAKLDCGFSICVGTVDGALVWTNMLYAKMDDMGVGLLKFSMGGSTSMVFKCKLYVQPTIIFFISIVYTLALLWTLQCG